MKRPSIFCIVAICSDSDRLVRRSFRSVLAQSHQPDYIVLVSNPSNKISQTALDDLHRELPEPSKLHILTNGRTQCIAGIWNAGISYALSVTDNAENTYIALLNEEDKWLPEHLSTCIEGLREFDVVVSEPVKGEEPQLLDSQLFSIEQLLTVVPAIESSRLCFRLSSVLRAGLFDENLSNTLVCDLFIRLVEIGERIHSARDNTVYLSNNEDEQLHVCSTPVERLQGLRSFEGKYWPRLCTSQEREPISKIGLSHRRYQDCESQARPLEPPSSNTPYHLILGIVSSDSVHLSRFLKELSILVEQITLSKITLLVIANRGFDKVIH